MQSLELRLFSEAPIYPEYEEAKLAQSLAYWKKIHARSSAGRAGAARPVARGGRTRASFATPSWLDVALRKKLAEGGKAAIESCDDPMIKLALAVDAEARAVRKEREDKVEGVEATNYALIAKALFEDKGDSVYPDATFTLRLAFGVVKGYEVDGKSIPPSPRSAEPSQHANAHGNTDPYELPASWHEAKKSAALNLETPLNFVSTADIIGGNSGSPVVNRDNEVVGLIFDGNIQSLVLDFGYDDKVARAVSVDSRGIVEALRSIYNADRLVKELAGDEHGPIRHDPAIIGVSRLRAFAGWPPCGVLARTSISSNIPVSSNEPMPTRPWLNVRSWAIIAGWFMSSKKTWIRPSLTCRTSRTWCQPSVQGVPECAIRRSRPAACH